MDESPDMEAVQVEIMGTQLRVRVPSDQVQDVHRAAQFVRDYVAKLKNQSDTPERAVMRAALQISFEWLTTERVLTHRLDDLRHTLGENLGASG
jgi:cell division protein ZapA (FtsZ GTPase activity inhibitor)